MALSYLASSLKIKISTSLNMMRHPLERAARIAGARVRPTLAICSNILQQIIKHIIIAIAYLTRPLRPTKSLSA